MRLSAVWNQQDQEYRALAEKVVGSPDPIPQGVLERSLGMLGFMSRDQAA